MSRSVLVDTGPLVAFLNRRDQHHERARAEILHITPPLRTCEAVIAETTWLLKNISGGHAAVAALLATGAVVLDFRLADEHAKVFDLMNRYDNVPMSLADGCLVRMSELQPEAELLTFDSDFLVYRRFGRDVVPTIGFQQ